MLYKKNHIYSLLGALCLSLIMGGSVLAKPMSPLPCCLSKTMTNDMKKHKGMPQSKNTQKMMKSTHTSRLSVTSMPKPTLGLSVGVQHYGVAQIKQFGLDSGIFWGINGTLPLSTLNGWHLRGSYHHGMTDFKGTASVTGKNKSTHQHLTGMISKEKTYQSQQLRLGLGYQSSLTPKWSNTYFGGLTYIKNEFTFNLLDITPDHDPKHFTFPENTSQQSLGVYLGIDTTYRITQRVSSTLSIDYAYAPNSDHDNLGGIALGLGINRSF